MTRNEIHKQLQRLNEEIEQERTKRLQIDVKLGGLEAQHAALSRLVASAGEDAQSVTERVARFIESQDQPVGAPEVVAHLRAEGVTFKAESISMLLSRHAVAGRLRKSGRGKYSGIRES